MKSTLFCILIFTLCVLSGSSQQWHWANTATSSGVNSEGAQVCTDNSGNVFSHGYSDGAITFGGTSLSAGFYIVKYNSLGTVIWAKNVGYSSGEMYTDAAGNLFIAGSYSANLNTATANYTSQGASDIFLIKLDGSGNEQWARSYGGPGNDGFYDFAVDRVGNCYFIGMQFSDTLIFANKTLIDTSNYGFFYLTRINPQGQTCWITRGLQASDSSYYGMGEFVRVDKNQNLYIVGSGQEGPGIGGYKFFGARFDSLGTILSDKFLGGAYLWNIYSFAMDDSSNFYTIEEGGHHPGMGALIKHDSAWNSKWYFDLGGQYWCYDLGNVKVDGFGNSYLNGGLYYIGENYWGCSDTANVIYVFGNRFVIKGLRDLLVAKIGPNGKLNWLKTAGGVGDEYSSDYFVSKNGDCFFTGAYNITSPWYPPAFGPTAFDNHVLPSDGSSKRCFTAKIGSGNVGLNEQTGEELFVKLYPNPVQGFFRIEGSGLESYEIYDAMGSVVAQGKIISENQKIELENVPAGLYVVKVKSGFLSQVLKIIVE